MTRKRYLLLVVVTRLITDVPMLWLLGAVYFGMRGRGGASDILINVALLAGFGVIHSLLARETAKRIVARLIGQSSVRIAYVMFAGVTLGLLLFFWRPISGEVWHAEGYAFWLLTAGFVASILALVYTTTFFDYHEFLGLRGIARSLAGEPPAPPRLSVKGPYAYCRHPMYSALAATFWVGPVMSAGRLEFALLGTLYLFVGLTFEERNLRQELGAAYDLYRANVPMFIPRWTPWRYPEAGVPTSGAEAEVQRAA